MFYIIWHECKLDTSGTCNPYSYHDYVWNAIMLTLWTRNACLQATETTQFSPKCLFPGFGCIPNRWLESHDFWKLYDLFIVMWNPHTFWKDSWVLWVKFAAILCTKSVKNCKIFGKFTKTAISLENLPSSIRCKVRINIQYLCLTSIYLFIPPFFKTNLNKNS